MKGKILITEQNDRKTITDYFGTSLDIFTQLLNFLCPISQGWGTCVIYHLVLTDVTESHCS